MIQRFNIDYIPSASFTTDCDGMFVLHTDHLRAMSALEEENKRLRSALADVAQRVCAYMPAYENVKESIAAKGEGNT